MKMRTFKIHVKKPWPLVLGVDISSSSLKYLLLRRTNRGLRVDGFGKYALEDSGMKPSENLRPIINLLFIKSKGMKQAKTIIGIEGSKVAIKKESFPVLSKKELLQTFFFEMQKELGKEGEEFPFVYDYLTLGTDSEKAGNAVYLIMGALEEAVEERVNPFVAEGVIPTKVIPTVTALANLVPYVSDLKNRKVAGILDIGAQKSVLVFIRDGKMDFYRDIIVGGDDFTKAITGTIFHEGRAIQFSTGEALEFKLRYGYPLGFSEGMTFRGAPLAEVGTMMRPVVERLIGEINRSIGFYKDKSKGGEVEILYLVGGGARLKHLSEVLSQKTGIPVSLLPFPEGFRVVGGKKNQETFKKKFLEQAVSFSLALESSTSGNLLPKPYMKIHRTTLIKKGLRYGAVGVVCFMVLLSLNIYSGVRMWKDRVVKVERRISNLKDTAPLYASLQVQKNTYEKTMGELHLHVQQDETLIQVLRLFSHVVPKNLTLISLKFGKEEKDTKKAVKEEQSKESDWIVRIEGANEKPSSDVGIYMAQFIMELEKSGYFSKIELQKEIFSAERKNYAFELVATLNKRKEKSVG